MGGFKLTQIKVHAFIYSNKNVEFYSVHTVDEGGPIINSTSEEEAKVKFEKAFRISCAVKNLFFFIGARKAQEPQVRKLFIDKFKQHEADIEYHAEAV